MTIDFARQIDAQVIVRGLRVFSDFEFEFRMALANQRLAKDIETVALITAEQHTFLSSSTVREIATLNGDVSSMVPPHVMKGFAGESAGYGRTFAAKFAPRLNCARIDLILGRQIKCNIILIGIL